MQSLFCATLLSTCISVMGVAQVTPSVATSSAEMQFATCELNAEASNSQAVSISYPSKPDYCGLSLRAPFSGKDKRRRSGGTVEQFVEQTGGSILVGEQEKPMICLSSWQV